MQSRKQQLQEAALEYRVLPVAVRDLESAEG
jgi:hypothetical protein